MRQWPRKKIRILIFLAKDSPLKSPFFQSDFFKIPQWKNKCLLILDNLGSIVHTFLHWTITGVHDSILISPIPGRRATTTRRRWATLRRRRCRWVRRRLRRSSSGWSDICADDQILVMPVSRDTNEDGISPSREENLPDLGVDLPGGQLLLLEAHPQAEAHHDLQTRSGFLEKNRRIL